MALLLAACSEPKAALTVLDQPEAVLGRGFAQVSNVVEIGPNQVALAERRDRTFLFADFATGTATPVGQHADSIKPLDPAPGQHKYPGYVLNLGPDTLGLVDFAAERTTIWTTAGAYVGIMPGRGIGGNNQPLVYDGKHNGYKEDVRGVLGGLEPGQEVNFDSLPVLRVIAGDTVADTVARLKLPVWGRGQFGEQMKIVSTIFSGRDLFGVLPDGSLWAARANDNRVDWRSPAGEWSQGPERSYATIPVEQAEKDMFLNRLRQQMASMGAPAGIGSAIPLRTASRPSRQAPPTATPAKSGCSAPAPSPTRCPSTTWWAATARRCARCSSRRGPPSPASAPTGACTCSCAREMRSRWRGTS
ncbi:MAG: hypothetical protein IPK12_03395 [Gemmatimonadetes bacterium]|nr:hypothetical protein [Gemmatimonadota bacterium]